MHVFHSGFILIWEGRSHVRPGPILLCEHHYYTLNTCRNSGVAGADRLILGGVAELFGENGVVLLKE